MPGYRPGRDLAARLVVLWLLSTGTLAWSAGIDPEPQNLDPIHTFQLTDKFKLDYTPLIWRVRAAQGKLWFLWSSSGAAARFYAASTTLGGQPIDILPLESTAVNADIVPTSRGFASLISRRPSPGSRSELILSEHDAQGRPLWNTRVPCGGFDALTAVGDRPALICGDGALTVYAEGAMAARKQTWGRHGTILIHFGANRIAVVDQATAQVLLQDLDTGTVSTVARTLPEVEEARQKNRAAEEAVRRHLGPEQAARPTRNRRRFPGAGERRRIRLRVSAHVEALT